MTRFAHYLTGFALIIVSTQTASAQSAPTQQFAPTVLASSSEWTLDYGNEYCALSRTFGTGEEQVQFQMLNFGRQSENRMVLSGGPIPHVNSAQGVLGIRLDGNTEFLPTYAVMGEAGGEAAASFNVRFLQQVYLDYLFEIEQGAQDGVSIPDLPHDPAFEQAIHAIDLDFGRTGITLQLGSMGPPLQALRDCRNNLLEHWGLDPEIQSSLSRTPLIRRSTVGRITSRYPTRAARDRQRAFVPVRVIVEADGEPRSCTVQLPTPDPSFDEAVCRGLESRFDPALDAEGNPVVGLYTVSVYFLMN